MAVISEVTIETVPHAASDQYVVRTTVQVGGSLVTLDCSTEGKPQLAALVDRLYSMLTDLALNELRSSLAESE